MSDEVESYVSFGAGTQSSTLALLAVNRDERLLEALEREASTLRWDEPIPLPSAYVFSDTGDEPVAVYRHLEDVMRPRIEDSGAELAVLEGDQTLLEHMEDSWRNPDKGGVASPPFFVTNESGGMGLTRRQCTSKFKVRRLDRWARDRFNVVRGRRDNPVYQWLGISADEMRRMKSSTNKWRRISHPLVFMNWSRSHCEAYLKEQGVTPVRSACVYCPFRGRDEWREIRQSPEDWKKVLRLDRLLEEISSSERQWIGIDGDLFLVRKPIRIRDEDFDLEDEDQLELWDWNSECSGVCGV